MDKPPMGENMTSPIDLAFPVPDSNTPLLYMRYPIDITVPKVSNNYWKGCVIGGHI
jgi:hypothetical protein